MGVFAVRMKLERPSKAVSRLILWDEWVSHQRQNCWNFGPNNWESFVNSGEICDTCNDMMKYHQYPAAM